MKTTTNEQQAELECAGVLGRVHDWHQPRNDDCAHNKSIDADCTCRHLVVIKARTGPRKVKTAWKIKVEDERVPFQTKPRLVVQIRANGDLIIRELGRRVSYKTSLGEVYGRLLTSHAVGVAARAKRQKHESKRAVKQAHKLARALRKTGMAAT